MACANELREAINNWREAHLFALNHDCAGTGGPYDHATRDAIDAGLVADLARFDNPDKEEADD